MKFFLSLFSLLFFSLLLGCQNDKGEKDALHALSDTTSITGLTGDSVKLVKRAHLQIKVKDVEQSTRAVSSLAQQFGGMLFNQNLESIETGSTELKLTNDSLLVITTYTPQAALTARIPSQHLETFMHQAAALGYYTSSSQLDIEDKSLPYLEHALKHQARQEALFRPVKEKGQAKQQLSNLDVKDDMVHQEMANRAIDAAVNYNTISLSLFQNPHVRKEVIANYILSDYQLPFGQRLQQAASNGWQNFLGFLLVLAHFWMFILLGILCYVGYKYFIQKNKLKILSLKP